MFYSIIHHQAGFQSDAFGVVNGLSFSHSGMCVLSLCSTDLHFIRNG